MLLIRQARMLMKRTLTENSAAVLSAGTPEPLGPSKISDTAKSGVNFALHSEHASKVTLILSDRDDKNTVEIPLEGEHHRSGNVWHAAIHGCPLSGVLYGYRVEGETGWETGDRHVAEPTDLSLCFCLLHVSRRHARLRAAFNQHRVVWMCRWDSTRVLLDPYAPLVKGRAKFAERDQFERFEQEVGVWPCSMLLWHGDCSSTSTIPRPAM